ncbi:MAG: metallopeptidase family protein [Candidatus Moraniibacteriota bacterium]
MYNLKSNKLFKISKEEFERIVAEGIDAIPEIFLKKLDNVAVFIESEPNLAQRKKLKLRKNWTLLGLYEGVPQTARGAHYTNIVPDKITIFQKPIEESAHDIDDVREIVKNTVWHEIAHHFGMDEGQVRSAEARRKSKKF